MSRTSRFVISSPESTQIEPSVHAVQRVNVRCVSQAQLLPAEDGS